MARMRPQLRQALSTHPADYVIPVTVFCNSKTKYQVQVILESMFAEIHPSIFWNAFSIDASVAQIKILLDVEGIDSIETNPEDLTYYLRYSV